MHVKVAIYDVEEDEDTYVFVPKQNRKENYRKNVLQKSDCGKFGTGNKKMCKFYVLS